MSFVDIAFLLLPRHGLSSADEVLTVARVALTGHLGGFLRGVNS